MIARTPLHIVRSAEEMFRLNKTVNQVVGCLQLGKTKAREIRRDMLKKVDPIVNESLQGSVTVVGGRLKGLRGTVIRNSLSGEEWKPYTLIQTSVWQEWVLSHWLVQT